MPRPKAGFHPPCLSPAAALPVSRSFIIDLKSSNLRASSRQCVRTKRPIKSMISQACQITLRVNPAIVPIREADIQPVAEVGDLHDGDPRKTLRKALVEARACAMRAFAEQPKLLRAEG